MSEYRFVAFFNSNTNERGFENKLLLSNLESRKESIDNKMQICFLNYDYKNKIEQFAVKKNNPLVFPEKLFIEVEKEISTQDLSFDSSIKLNQTIQLKQTVSKKEYIEKVAALKQHIQQGDIYEINYCITFEAHDVTINPVEVYQKLNAISRAPYSSLCKFDKQYIISSSPELFLSKKQNVLITKPIKGTSKRGVSEQEDELLSAHLKTNIKECTENVMIVDVARNDLSRIATKGSVKVDVLFGVETFQQVHQLVSTVSCELKNNKSFDDIIRASFPMASMTGAPKIKAMQLIDEYELYNRGPYSGALGYINANGDFDLSVLIRSIFYDEEQKYLSFSVGSAITSLCNADEEYDECMLKAKALIQILENN